MRVTCKKCEIKFSSISLLRKHQWKEHIETFNNLKKSASNRKKQVKNLKEMKLIPVVNLIQEVNSSNELTVNELLAKLTQQKNFLSDVVNLIQGMAVQFRKEQEVGKAGSIIK